MDSRNTVSGVNMQDRNPFDYISPERKERAKNWLDAANNLVSYNIGFIYMAVENLMYSELSILEMEAKLARRVDDAPHPIEPLFLQECSCLSLLWVCGLYEVTRILNRSPANAVFSDLHRRLSVLRMPLAKHEVQGKGKQPHHPTSTWYPETGHVGWLVHDPRTNAIRSYFRAELADEFLILAIGQEKSK